MQPQPTIHATRRSLITSLLLGFILLGTLATGETRHITKDGVREVVPKSPGEIASQVCVILANRKTPWQIYRTYAGLFMRFAKNQQRVPAGTREAQQKRQRTVIHYRNMAGLLQQMQACAVVRDGIKHNRTDVPFGERQSTYEEEGKKLGSLLRQFATMGSKLRGFKLPKKSPRKR
jgi:hypothetical protein